MRMGKRRSSSLNRDTATPPSAADATSGGDPINSGPEQTNHLIVGIGASAGGLEAFRSFFSEMPSDSGIAFVLVQHLDPEYNSALAEIIGECTAMPVVKAADGTFAAPNTVAVIPPNAILKIDGGVLRVALPETPTARRSSIDTFLVSLAEDQGENAVGIILSGFGSDGTIGIAAIKEGGGLTLSEASFDHRAKYGMPLSAVAGGFVDFVLQPHEMPARLLEFRDFRNKSEARGLLETKQTGEANYLVTICAVLNSRLGRDFSQYKSSTMMRRVLRRMQVLHIEDPNEYIAQLRKLPNEPDLLFREILIGVTRFFRDPAMFETLAETVLPALISGGEPDEPIRIWVAGCATGEEAYSLAILFYEALLQAESTRHVTIFATDIDDRAVTIARSGIYDDIIEADNSVERLEKHFVKEGQRYRIAKHIRDLCVFSTHDLVKDPPFSRLDMISCRNLLIYFEAPLQQRVIATFHYGIKSNGFLWLGPSETIAASGRFFKSFDKRCRIFRRLNVAAEILRVPVTTRLNPSSPVQRSVEADSIDAQATRAMAQYSPAYIVFDSQHEIQRFSGPVAKFMEPASGGASLNLFRMLHAQLRPPVRSLVRKAHEGQRPVQETVSFEVAGQAHAVNLIAQPLTETAGAQRCMLLAFQEVIAGVGPDYPAKSDKSPLVDHEHSELIAAREKLQTITEELETANEELQSSNEEFQSVNEELHSTVEELETSKEELQSINEELHSVNEELNNRADKLVRSNSDLANLFDSTSVATLFLDNKSNIRRFTPAITEIFNVREGDEGRLFSDFSSRLAGSALTEDIATVLRDLGSLEREAESEDGQATYLIRVKPYRDLNNVIDGVVITLIDISERKMLERDQAHLAAIVASSEDAIISHDLDGLITSWNTGATKIYGYSVEEMIGRPMSTLLDDVQLDEWPANLIRLRQGRPVTDIDISRVTKGDRVVYVSLAISPMRDAQGVIIGASAVARDIALRKRAEVMLRESESRLQLACDVAAIGAWETDLKSGTAIWTHRIFDILGIDRNCAASASLFFNYVHPDDVARVEERFKASIASRTLFNEDFRIQRPDGEIRYVVGMGRVSEGDIGEPTRMVGVNYDITDRKREEEHTAMLMDELDHRVKNILAVVSSVVTQTLKKDSSVQSVRTDLEGRIQAIARAHGLLRELGGAEGSLSRLVAMELKPYNQRANVRTAGDDVLLTSRANLSLGLAVHELATNAAKYGSLSTEEGHLEVTWHVVDAAGEPVLEILWLETCGPPVTQPKDRGFGTKLIELSLVRGLSAKVNREFLEAGVRCTITVPFTPEIGRIRKVSAAGKVLS